MRIMVMAVCGALALNGAEAWANEAEDFNPEYAWAYSKCFDEALLRYVDCPGLEDAPDPLSPAPTPPPARLGGAYLGVKGGVGVAGDAEIGLGAGALEAAFEPGFVAGALAGYDFGPVASGVGLRADLELGHMGFDVDETRLAGAPQAGSAGALEVFYGFANLYGDVALVGELDLVVGGGIGLGRVAFDRVSGGGGVLADAAETAFGYHLDAGLAYDVASHWTLAATYRFADFLVEDLDAGAGSPDVSAHQGLLELRYRF